MDPGTLALHADALEDSSFRVRLATLLTLHELEPATIAQHAHAIVARLEDAPFETREMALKTLGKLDPAALAQHADAVAARLEDSNWWVRSEALRTLGELNPTALAQHADAVANMLEESDSAVRQGALHVLKELEPATLAQHVHDHIDFVFALLIEDCTNVGITSDTYNERGVLFDTLRALPLRITRDIDFKQTLFEYTLDNALEDKAVCSRLLARLRWHRCQQRLHVQRIALYWYALPYRPGGPGHARDVEAWDRMNETQDQRIASATQKRHNETVEDDAKTQQNNWDVLTGNTKRQRN